MSEEKILTDEMIEKKLDSIRYTNKALAKEFGFIDGAFYARNFYEQKLRGGWIDVKTVQKLPTHEVLAINAAGEQKIGYIGFYCGVVLCYVDEDCIRNITHFMEKPPAPSQPHRVAPIYAEVDVDLKSQIDRLLFNHMNAHKEERDLTCIQIIMLIERYKLSAPSPESSNDK